MAMRPLIDKTVIRRTTTIASIIQNIIIALFMIEFEKEPYIEDNFCIIDPLGWPGMYDIFLSKKNYSIRVTFWFSFPIFLFESSSFERAILFSN